MRPRIGVLAAPAIVFTLAVGSASAASAARPGPDNPPLPAQVKEVAALVPEDEGRTGRGATSATLAARDATVVPLESGESVTFPPDPDSRGLGPLYAVGGSTVLSDAQMSIVAGVSDRPLTRLAGTDRYLTAVAVSRVGFPRGADIAFVATGENFPDGLAASATAGALGGPVLLARQSSVAPEVLAELTRLAPSAVRVVGGPSVVDDGVAATIRATLPKAAVTRVFGPSRTETAAALSALVPDQHEYVFLATAEDYPDALSAAPAAAKVQAPLLLSARGSLSTAARAELSRLKPRTAYLVGGADALSDAVADQVRSTTGGAVVRLSGPDRYATAAAVVHEHFDPTTPTLTFATGQNYPDALGAGALAATTGGPVLLGTDAPAPPRASLDEAKAQSWYRPASGQVTRYILVVHPDDEMSARSLLEPDPRVYDVFIMLTRGETSAYCTGEPVANPWVDQQYLPVEQPTGLAYSDRCKQHRLDSWETFLTRTGIGGPLRATATTRIGAEVVWNGAVLPAPVRLDENRVEVPATSFDLAIGMHQARAIFDLGVLQPYEIVWALENVRALREEFAPGAQEGDIVGAGYHNSTRVGSIYDHEDHQSLYETLTTQDLGVPGSQYVPVGHYQAGRVFGASVADYCADMCHPAAPEGYRDGMGHFQFSYGWLRDGQWPVGELDVPAGMSAYQSFTKTF